MNEVLDGDRLLKGREVAEMFRVDPKTITRWASDEKLPSVRTPGGHRRFRESVVRAALLQQLAGQVSGDRAGSG